MSTQIFDTDERRVLLREVRSYLHSRGWVVKVVEENWRIDLDIQKEDLHLCVKCLDGSDLNCMSVGRLFSEMKTDTRDLFTLESRRLVWILRHDFLPVTMDNLIRESVLAIPFDEISRLDKICDTSLIEVENLSPFEIEVLKVNLKACIKISEKLQREGDLDKAIDWLYAAKRASLHFSSAYHSLFDLLIKAGRLQEAYSVGGDALSRRPGAKPFMEPMEALALSLGHENDVGRWKSGSGSVSDDRAVPRDFDALIAKMKKNADLNTSPISESSSSITKDDDRRSSSPLHWLKRKLVK